MRHLSLISLSIYGINMRHNRRSIKKKSKQTLYYLTHGPPFIALLITRQVIRLLKLPVVDVSTIVRIVVSVVFSDSGFDFIVKTAITMMTIKTANAQIILRTIGHNGRFFLMIPSLRRNLILFIIY